MKKCLVSFVFISPVHDLGMNPSEDMYKHMKFVNKLSDQIVEKARELDAAFVVN
jgi:hypothetical protein